MGNKISAKIQHTQYGYRSLIKYFKINEADMLPASIHTVKSSLGILTKYKKYVSCPKCHKLYNPLEIKEYKEDDQSACKRYIHIEFPNHRSMIKWSPCHELLAELINTKEGALLWLLKLYPIRSIKQQLYIMYQRAGFENMLRHSSNRNVPNGVFLDIYEGNI